jgi:hypothetical protein
MKAPSLGAILPVKVTAKPHVIPRRMTSSRAARDRLDDTSAPGRARLVLSLGPATVVAGLIWALLQPYRITLLEPREESFWWLAVQPPLLVILVGVAFHFAVARGVVRDLVERDRAMDRR